MKPHRIGSYARKGIIKACTCIVCGIEFQTTHRRKYCSPRCNPNITVWDNSPRICRTCGQSYMPLFNKQKTCKRTCNPYKKPYSDGFYQSKGWIAIKAQFKASYTVVNGIKISNLFCIECYRKHNTLNDIYAVDHIIPRREGGTEDFNNLQSLCKHHHQSKSAVEGNRRRQLAQTK